MKKKGQALPGLGFAIIVAIFLFMVGMLSVNFLRDEVTSARSSANMNCADSGISDGSKLLCLVIDLTIPYFIIIIIAAAGGYITQRFAV